MSVRVRQSHSVHHSDGRCCKRGQLCMCGRRGAMGVSPLVVLNLTVSLKLPQKESLWKKKLFLIYGTTLILFYLGSVY